MFSLIPRGSDKKAIVMPVRRLLISYSKVLVFLVQLGLIVASYVMSFVLHMDLDLVQIPWGMILITLPLLIVIRMATLELFSLNQGLWRYVSVVDLLRLIKATTVGSLAFIALEIAIFGLQDFPLSVFVLDWIGNIFLLGGVRLIVRLVRLRYRPIKSVRSADSAFRRLLIIGAGDAGAALCRQARSSPSFGFDPVALVDDDPSKVGNSILGVPIVGGCLDISRIVHDFEVDLVVIAIPSATPAQRRTIVEACQHSSVEFKVLPGTPQLIDGTVSISHIRAVDPIDLLGRPSARLDPLAIERFVGGKRLLVTGAAGSIGSELARQVARSKPELLLLIDQAENSLLFLETEIHSSFPDTQLEVRIADVTDEFMMRRLMAEYQPQIVLHAAAHKHVSFMERAPVQAVKNNVGGTYVLGECAREFGVETFVLVSTDKAVKPASVMGATKRLGELIIQDMNRLGPTCFVAVRFGNVLGSNGSVVPIFKQQIADGGPVTVTDPDVTRYFMSIHEAAGLILQAGAIGSGGDIVVLDMGEPIPIVELAETLISLSGFKCYEDIDIVFTGLRPGEKLHEELYDEGEELRCTGHEKLLVLKNGHPIRNIIAEVEDLLRLLPSIDGDEAKHHLRRLVPEYQPAGVKEEAVVKAAL